MGFFDFFPYTNFHNVNLDWVLQRVKEWGELVEANDTAFHELEEANASFKAYVESYLENLDIQDEIDDKLDRMFESGVLGEYLQPYVSPVVTTWLDENITQPTGVVIDSSLTVSGACADAKAVGDRIKPLEYTGEDYFKTSLINCLQKMVFIDSTGEELITNLKSAMRLGEIFKFPDNTTIIHGNIERGTDSIATLNTATLNAGTLCATNRGENSSTVPFYNIYPFKQGEYNKVTVNCEYPTNGTLTFAVVQLTLQNGTYFVKRLGTNTAVNSSVNINPDNYQNYLAIVFRAVGFTPDSGITNASIKITKE